MCPTDETLRAKIDGELSRTEMIDVEIHMTACAGCRERSEVMSRQAREVGHIFATLAVPPGEPVTDPGIALARFKARQRAAEVATPSFAERLFARRLRPAWAALAAACLALGLLSFAPARSMAQRILAMLRVQKITVVPVDLKSLGGPDSENAAGKLIGQMISDNVVVTLHGQPQDVVSAEEASQRAGYKVRLLGERADAPRLTVEGEQAFHMTVDRERVQSILAELGHSDVNLPASLDGATLAAHIPSVVVARYGNCPSDRLQGESAAENGAPSPAVENSAASNCVMLVQVPSPTVSVPPELNLQQLAEAGLQVAGMTAEQAHAFCQTVDWTSTLVVPIPRDISSYQTVAVDGVEGTLINLPRERRHPAGYSLVWVKSGVIYSLTGFGNSADAVPLAETLN